MTYPAKLERREKRRLKNCRVKAEFKSKRRAAWRAKELQEETGKKWRHYLCPNCQNFHLTTH